MRNNLPNITALRFFMALLVVLYHVPQFMSNRGFPSYNALPIFNRGTEAVYFFFALSGFLIIRNLYVEKKSTGTIALKTFYKRRILRIFPLYYAVLIFGLLYYNWILPALGYPMENHGHNLTEIIVLGGTFFSNIMAKQNPGGILEILWSIGIEEQFYLLIAPLFLLLPLRRMVLFLVMFTMIYFVLFHTELLEIISYYRMYFYYFSASGLMAILAVSRPDLKFGVLVRTTVIAAVVIYFFTDFFASHLSEIGYQLLSTILFPLFIFVMIQRSTVILESRILKYFGKISYGIYMLHSIVMQAVGFLFLKIFAWDSEYNAAILIILFNLLTVAITLLASHWSYKYFESYFIKFKQKIP